MCHLLTATHLIGSVSAGTLPDPAAVDYPATHHIDVGNHHASPNIAHDNTIHDKTVGRIRQLDDTDNSPDRDLPARADDYLDNSQLVPNTHCHNQSYPANANYGTVDAAHHATSMSCHAPKGPQYETAGHRISCGTTAFSS
ncbi:hypothetical protein [Nocardia sp. NPDC052316]|uniref:hypothetical protein n=1 Tax=Nocardia sp. NPDC052316 TaxID=3364329 RepID=UPI0037C5F612